MLIIIIIILYARLRQYPAPLKIMEVIRTGIEEGAKLDMRLKLRCVCISGWGYHMYMYDHHAGI